MKDDIVMAFMISFLTGTSAVEAICLAVVIAEKVHARNFVYALR